MWQGLSNCSAETPCRQCQGSGNTAALSPGQCAHGASRAIVFDQTEDGHEYFVWQQAPPCPAHAGAGLSGDSPLPCSHEPGTVPPRSVGRLLMGSKTYAMRSCSMLPGDTQLSTYLCLHGPWAGIKEIRRMRSSIQGCHRVGLRR